MANTISKLISQTFRNTPVLILSLCQLFLSSNTFAANEEVKFDRFKVTNKKNAAVSDLLLQLNLDPSADTPTLATKTITPKLSPQDEKQALEALKNAVASGKGDSADLQFIGTVGLHAGFYKRNESMHVVPKVDGDTITHFYSTQDSGVKNTSPIESGGVNIHRIPIFDASRTSDNFVWVTSEQITPNAWDLIFSQRFPLENVKWLLLYGNELKPLRDENYEAFKGSGAPQTPAPQTKLYNAKTEEPSDKVTLDNLRLSVIEQQIYTTVYNETDCKKLYHVLSEQAKYIKNRLQNLALIDDVLGSRVQKINILLCSEPHSSPVPMRAGHATTHTTSEITLQSKTYEFLGFEYIRNLEADNTPCAEDIRWDVLKHSKELLLPNGWTAEAKLRRKTTRLQVSAVLAAQAAASVNGGSPFSSQQPHKRRTHSSVANTITSAHAAVTNIPEQSDPSHIHVTYKTDNK